MDTVLWLCPSLPTETLKWLSSLPILMQKSFWWWQCSDRYIISVSPHLHTPFPPFSPSLISHPVSVDLKHHVYLLMAVKKRKKKSCQPGWPVFSVCTLSKALDVLQSAGKLEADMVQQVQDFIAANRFPVNGHSQSSSKNVGDGLSPEKRTKKVWWWWL